MICHLPSAISCLYIERRGSLCTKIVEMSEWFSSWWWLVFSSNAHFCGFHFLTPWVRNLFLWGNILMITPRVDVLFPPWPPVQKSSRGWTILWGESQSNDRLILASAPLTVMSNVKSLFTSFPRSNDYYLIYSYLKLLSAGKIGKERIPTWR